MEAVQIAFGAAQIGLLTAIFFRLGVLTRAIHDHDRRIAALEPKKETGLELSV